MAKRKFVAQYPIKSNPMLDKDFYKEFHGRCLPKGMTQSVSYFTPRRSRVTQWPEAVIHGYQAFIKQYLIDEWNRNFFCRPEDEVVEEYARVIENTLGQCDRDRVRALHQLGYLPLEIYALPEGTLCPMGVPFFSMVNTHPDFAWLAQALESIISTYLWKPMYSATIGHTYRKIVNSWYQTTCDSDVPRRYALGNFDMRGDDGKEDALMCASGWLLSFVNTATVMSIPYMEALYGANCETDEVGRGGNSTEHFVMCSNSAKDIEDNQDYGAFENIDPRRERVFLKRLLTEICPHENVSCVCDSYDYFNVVNNILPTLRAEILGHNTEDGKPCTLLIRGDSGDPVDIIVETVKSLWSLELPGNKVNSKGFKVLDPHVKALYGDSIQPITAEIIYSKLATLGFAACNVSLGVGSYSMHAINEVETRSFTPDSKFGKVLKKIFPGAFQFTIPVARIATRDTFSTACKSQSCIIDGSEIAIYKDPKTDKGTGFSFKKSHRGCCRVYVDDSSGKLACLDGLSYKDSLKDTVMIPVFRDGKIITDQTLKEIRDRLNNENF